MKESGINGNTTCQDGPGRVAVNGLEFRGKEELLAITVTTEILFVCPEKDCTRMLRNKEALRELSKSRCAGCTGSRWGQLDWGMHLHDEGNFMEGVSNDRHCNNAGCGTGVFRIPRTEMP